MAKLLNEYKDQIVNIKDMEIRRCIQHLLVKSPKWYFTVDNKLFQKNTIKVINVAKRIKNKFNLTDKEFDICISAIFLADTCYYSGTDEIWRDTDVIKDHAKYVRKYFIKKCPVETAHLNTIGVFDSICTCILNHETRIGSEPLDKLSMFVNMSFFISTLEEVSVKTIDFEDLVAPEAQLFT